MKPILLRVHRWVALVLALPLAVIILTGLVLSLEPIAQDLAFKPQSLTGERLLGLLARHDPEGKTRAISIRAYENRLTLNGPGAEGEIDFDLATGAIVVDDARTLPSDIFRFSRGLHEHFIADQGWVVVWSTIGMLVLIVLGAVMGWPRLRGSVSGWHQGMAWFLLPLLVLSPLTGLALAFGITLSTPQPRERSEPVAIRDAVQILAAQHDLSGLIWLRQRGGRLLARINEGGVFKVYALSKQSATLTATNWPRALHEGNFAGVWSGAMVLITALGFTGLLGTGLVIYLRRLFRKPNRSRMVPQSISAE